MSAGMVLLTLDLIALVCSSNVKNISNIKPKCFCDDTCSTGSVLKKTGGYTTLSTLRVKFETHFPLENPFLYFV